MATGTFVLPGDHLDPDLLPTHVTLPLKLGPGLRHIPPNTVSSTVAGYVCSDARKNAIWVESSGSRYTASVGDLVVATVHHSSADVYHARLSDYTAFATLPQLAFEAATKKTRPQLTPGTLVYARIALANRHMDPELECVSAATGKADGLGPLVGGMLFDISLAMSRRLMMSRPAEQGAVVLLDELGALGVAFEIAVGRNGKLWVNSKTLKATIAIGKAVQEIDSRRLGVEEQKKMARNLAREL